MLGTSRRLLSSLTLFTFVCAFAIPSLVLIESAKAKNNVEFVRDHTTYYVCRCPSGVGWMIVDDWVDERREIAWIGHPPPKIVLKKVNGVMKEVPEHVFHNITYNMQETSEYVKLSSDDYRCEALED
ncbi:MAG: hypothetical protein OXU51_13495 [Candidatus Poribacteria bacterium]|nr:hypothetical protein [Candidatus Poribacteria bacterium]